MSGLRQWALFAVCAAGLAGAGVALAAALAAEPAGAYGAWAHDGATACSCHTGSPPSDAKCATCHTGFVSVPSRNCWTCHKPGADTSSLATPSSACYQTCHLFSPVTKNYTRPFTHGDNPHLGSTPDCLACHQTSPGIAEPGDSPHHNGQPPGFTVCDPCHGQEEHDGTVACVTCHTDASAFHLYQAPSPGFKLCADCHSKTHAGRRVPASKCVSCHKGSGSVETSQAQHSDSITKKLKCNQSGCHSKALHASRRGSGIKSCGRCHKTNFHARQKVPPSSICKSCHPMSRRHTNGYACRLCHRGAIHKTRPSAGGH